jgi:fluoride ion exporter CrcB/FEX
MDTVLFKFVTAGIRVWIITITIYVTFREPNGTLTVNHYIVGCAHIFVLKSTVQLHMESWVDSCIVHSLLKLYTTCDARFYSHKVLV